MTTTKIQEKERRRIEMEMKEEGNDLTDLSRRERIGVTGMFFVFMILCLIWRVEVGFIFSLFGLILLLKLIGDEEKKYTLYSK